ncbi:MAG TPA: class I SAM-dependent methyltransferase, partial [Chloroflexota bacterium]|nr:class I SAM-dependent methyltransferase [Chloroflexota bacterium]
MESRLAENRRAFDGVAADYDGPLGNNLLIQRMRLRLWQTIEASLAPGSRLLDLGCGTGLDAVHLALRGYQVLATDWSPRMVARTQARIESSGVGASATAQLIGLHQLDRLDGERFDGIYSDLGPLNCAPDLAEVAGAAARLLRPGGLFVASVIGRRCPWEALYYILRGDLDRARVRSRRGSVPVGLNGNTVWTRYFTPGEFYREFAGAFELRSYRGLGLFLPPPYLLHVYRRWPRLFAACAWLDDRLGALPAVREAGDHFLIVLARRASANRVVFGEVGLVGDGWC